MDIDRKNCTLLLWHTHSLFFFGLSLTLTHSRTYKHTHTNTHFFLPLIFPFILFFIFLLRQRSNYSFVYVTFLPETRNGEKWLKMTQRTEQKCKCLSQWSQICNNKCSFFGSSSAFLLTKLNLKNIHCILERWGSIFHFRIVSGTTCPWKNISKLW